MVQRGLLRLHYRADEIEKVKEHLCTCAGCAEAYEFEGEVLERVRNKVGHLDIPAELAERIGRALDAAEKE